MIENIAKRAQFVYWFVFAISLYVIVQIFNIQYISPSEITSSDISYRVEEIEAVRGSILSRDGRSLASSVPYYQVRMDCKVPSNEVFNKYIGDLSKELSKFFKDKSAYKYKRELIQARKKGNRYKAVGNRLVDYSELAEIKKFPIFKLGANRGGIVTVTKNKRSNPYGRLAYRTIGYLNSVGVGTGIESSYDFYMKGKNGSQTLQRVLGGEWMPVKSEDRVEPQDGIDVQTTIDIGIQEAAEFALKRQLALTDGIEGATAIVMEVKSGAVRAVANMKKNSNGTYDESFNYAIGESTEPGSTFKLATLIALIEDGYVNLSTPVDAGNGEWRYSTKSFTDVKRGGYGEINVLQAFEKSSNVAFAKLAVEHYAENEQQFIDRINNMKIGERFNLDIAGESRALIHSPGDNMWSKLTLPMMSMGYATLLTPLHTLTFYNAIANNGKMMKPYFVDCFKRDRVVVEQFFPQEISGSICSQSTIDAVKIALRGVVVEGTGKSINDPRYAISGKTGTAQIAFDGKYIDEKGYRKHQASFAGFFPSEDPRYSIIVVLYSSKTKKNFYGASWASPVFKYISDAIYATTTDWERPMDGSKVYAVDTPGFKRGNAEQEYVAISELPMKRKPDMEKRGWVRYIDDSTKTFSVQEDLESGVIPSLLGMGLKDALFLLENEGYTVSFSGMGRVVSQQPMSGEFLKRGGLITIVLK